MARFAEMARKTKETDVNITFEVDGEGISNIDTGIGFLDHMLDLFTKHGLFNLEIKCKGDLEVDAHHTVEDIGIVLGTVIKEALGDKSSIKRYGSSYVPMDEALGFVTLDLSGRPFIVYDAELPTEMTGDMESQLFEEFFRAVAFNAGMTLHMKNMYGTNSHHIIEAIFKAFGRALRVAVDKDDRIRGVMSTKGVL